MAPVLERAVRYFPRPGRIFAEWRLRDLRPNFVGGLTAAVVAVPQAMASTATAHVPPSYWLSSAAVASTVGALGGSSRHLSTGRPTPPRSRCSRSSHRSCRSALPSSSSPPASWPCRSARSASSSASPGSGCWSASRPGWRFPASSRARRCRSLPANFPALLGLPKGGATRFHLRVRRPSATSPASMSRRWRSASRRSPSRRSAPRSSSTASLADDPGRCSPRCWRVWPRGSWPTSQSSAPGRDPCRNRRRSTRAMNWLLDLGFPRVCNLKGGTLSWQARGRPLDVS